MKKKLINKFLIFMQILVFIFLSCVSTIKAVKIDTVEDCYYYKGHTYIYIKKGVIWLIARDLCERVGGHLVVIEEGYENTVVTGIINMDTWMGLTDEDSEGEFKWVNGKELTCRYWANYEPNRFVGDEDYVFFSKWANYRWADGDITWNLYFVCEFDFKITNMDKLAQIKDYLYGLTAQEIVLTTRDYEIMTEEEIEAEEVAVVEEETPIERPEREVITEELPLVTVMDFTIENMSKSEGLLIVDLVISALFRTKEFRVLDRSQRDNILNEMEFSFADCTDESCQLEMGRLLAADQIVVGSIGKVGNRFILNTKLIEVTTGVTLSTAYNIFNSLDELVDGTEKIVDSLCFEK